MSRIRDLGAKRYGPPLLLILLSMIFIMAAPAGKWAEVIALNLQAFALFASVRAARPHTRVRVAVGVLIGIIIAASWAEALLTVDVAGDFAHLATFLLVLIATPVIALGLVRQVREVGKITTQTMLGVICIYLLMCLAFASAFAAISSISGDPFFTQGASWDKLSNYLYYSLTTITTMGIGDLTPATSIGRSLTAAEGLIGQIYVVTVVAVIVGNLGRTRNDG